MTIRVGVNRCDKNCNFCPIHKMQSKHNTKNHGKKKHPTIKIKKPSFISSKQSGRKKDKTRKTAEFKQTTLRMF